MANGEFCLHNSKARVACDACKAKWAARKENARQRIETMSTEFTVKVEVVDVDGNIPFTLKVPATKEDLFLPGHATPGISMVLAYLEHAVGEGE